MSSLLIVTSVDRLQPQINAVVRALNNMPGAFISLNKTQRSTEQAISSAGVGTDKIFFIDCVTSEKTREDVLHLPPDALNMLAAAIGEFVQDVKGQKYILVDSLPTLLIYNSSAKVAQFVKQLTDFASRPDVNLIAFSPKTKGEDLLNMVYNFFEKVEER